VGSSTFQEFLDDLIKRVPKLYGVFVSDTDGVLIAKGCGEQFKDRPFDVSFAAAFASHQLQASKLQLGANKSIITIYENLQIYERYLDGIIVTFVVGNDGNVGLLDICIPEMQARLRPFYALLQQHQQPSAND